MKKSIGFFMLVLLASSCSLYSWVARHTKLITAQDLTDKELISFSNANDKQPFTFTQLIFSWNAIRPKKGYFRFSGRVRDAKTQKWLTWHKMFEWGAHVQRSFMSSGKDGSRYQHVRLELSTQQPADVFDIKIEPIDGANLHDLKFVSVTTSRLHEMEPESDVALKKLATVYIKGVPRKSQMQLEHPDSTRICSPTSTSMLASYLTGKTLDPIAFAEWSFDQGLGVYGSWPFNTAHAYEHTYQNNVYFGVTRLHSFSELHNFLLRKTPVVVSVRGDLPGAPKSYPAGHLIVVVGYDARKKQVVCHDPAHKEDRLTLTRYNIKDFLAAWERSHRLAYVTEYH